VNDEAYGKDRSVQTIAFACVYTRIINGENDITFITALAAKSLNKPKTDYAVYQRALKINAHIHNKRDEDGDYVFNQASGVLSDKWSDDMQALSIHLEKEMPPAFLPTNTPTVLTYPAHDGGTQLINTQRKFAFQQPSDKVTFYDAINVLQAQEFRLSQDMLDLRNLPIALTMDKNYSARQMMMNSLEAFKGTFHFDYTMDYRGRVYCRSLICNTQGDSFAKSFFRFAESKPLGQYGHAALKIHFANASGHDKESFVDRLAWANEQGLLKAYKMVAEEGNWTAIEPLIEDHKHGFEEYTAACELVRVDQWLGKGKDAQDFKSALITHQDATNSGFQFGAALTGDRQTAIDCNITSGLTKHDKPADLYGKMAVNLNNILATQELPMSSSIPLIDRKFCKKPIMVTGYGAGIAAVMRDIQGDYDMIEDEHLEWLQPHVQEALHQTASAMVDTTKVMHAHAKDIVENGDENTVIEWTAPDGFHIVQQKRDNSGRRIELSNKQCTFEKLQRGYKDPIDEAGMTKALPPNFIHSMDAQMLRTAALGASRKDISFAPIHDSFGTHAGSFFELNTLLKLAFVQTMDYDWYGEFCKANKVEPQDIKLGDYNARECLGAVYMFS